MKVGVFSAKSHEEAKKKVNSIIEKGLNPTLAIVFASVSTDLTGIRNVMRETGVKLFGASSSGEILACEGCINSRVVLEKSIVGALIDINERLFETRMFDAQDQDPTTLGEKVASWGMEIFEEPAFLILGSGIQLDADGLLEGILRKVKHNTPIIGGIAGDDGAFKETYVFNEDTENNFGVLVTVFDSKKLEINNIAANGWTGIGTEKKVTKSNGNVVISIDNTPAAELYSEYLNIAVEEIPKIGVEYPLLLKREDGGYILRAVIGANPKQKSLITAGKIPEGSTIMFSAAAGTGATENVKEVMKEFSREVKDAEFIILFSCVARHLAIGPLAEEEIIEAEKLWKAPIIGYFTYGGFGRLIGRNYDFHNETISLAIMKEK